MSSTVSFCLSATRITTLYFLSDSTQMDGWVVMVRGWFGCVDGWVGGCVYGWVLDCWMDRWVGGVWFRCVDVWIGRWVVMHGWMELHCIM